MECLSDSIRIWNECQPSATGPYYCFYIITIAELMSQVAKNTEDCDTGEQTGKCVQCRYDHGISATKILSFPINCFFAWDLLTIIRACYPMEISRNPSSSSTWWWKSLRKISWSKGLSQANYSGNDWYWTFTANQDFYFVFQNNNQRSWVFYSIYLHCTTGVPQTSSNLLSYPQIGK